MAGPSSTMSSPTHRRGPVVIQSSRPIIITIDGPAGTGKSSVARTLALRLGLDFLDTGAMYRAAAAIVLDRGLPRDDVDRIVREVAGADLHFDWSADPPRIMAWGRPIDRRIRDADVEGEVSAIAGIGALRRHLVAKQRMIAFQHPRLVTEGRDQGSVVFPDAPVKFYLDATPAVRARRRAEQLRALGRAVDPAVLERDIRDRDRSDSSRTDGPLICPPDAHRLDTSDLTFDQVVDHLESRARRAVAAP
jgi:cytidylate kinase